MKQDHKVKVPIKTKEAIAVLRNYCPSLAEKSDMQLSALLNRAIKRGDIPVTRLPETRTIIYNNRSVIRFAKHLRDCRKVAGDVPEQCELPIEEKRDLCFTITVNNNFQF